MSLIVLGINHQTAPVGLRERVAFGSDAMPRALAELRAMPAVREVALPSTCNRTELYALADDTGDALAEWLASHPDAGDLHAYLYRHRDADAVRERLAAMVPAGVELIVRARPLAGDYGAQRNLVH